MPEKRRKFHEEFREGAAQIVHESGKLAVLQLGDGLLDDGVVPVAGVGLDGGQGGVGDEPVVAPGGEQFALPGRGGGVEARDTSRSSRSGGSPTSAPTHPSTTARSSAGSTR